MPNVLSRCSAQKQFDRTTTNIDVLYKGNKLYISLIYVTKTKKNHKGIVKVCSVSQHCKRPDQFVR